MSTITSKIAAYVNDHSGKQVNIAVWQGFFRRMCHKFYVYNPELIGHFFGHEIRVFDDPRIITSHRIRILGNY